MKKSAKKRALATALRDTVPGISERNVRYVVGMYAQNWRTYHGLGHPLFMLQTLEKTETGLVEEELRMLRVMIIYHDVIYLLGENGTGGRNEYESAKVATQHLLSTGESDSFAGTVYSGIVATIDHTLKGVPNGERRIIRWLLDLDLYAGLGGSIAEFRRATEMIREEYSPVYTREQFDAGRSAWAKNMLEAKSSIFITKPFSQYNASARAGLQELA